MVGKYKLAPYMACGHGCTYCDGRAERYYVEGDFERDIVARPNVASLLADELPKLREKGFVSIGSGITDPYQPVEQELELTRACAQLLAASSRPAVVLTKNSLVLRDIDHWSELNQKSRFVLVMSLVHSDDATRTWSEPGASSVAERLKTLREFKRNGCATGVLAMPLLPYIHDSNDQIRRLYDSLAEVGVDFIMPGTLTLRPGRQKQHFLNALQTNHPELLPDYLSLYQRERASGAPYREYSETVIERALAHNRDLGIPSMVPHRVYRGILHKYDELSILLAHMIDLYSHGGTDTRRLVDARRRYLDWLTARKAVYNRKPSLRYLQLDQELQELLEPPVSPSPSTVEPEPLGNAKLTEFARRIVLEDAEFSYESLRLAEP